MFKKVSKKYILFFVLVIIVIGILCWATYTNRKPNDLKVDFLDIGQGDAIYIEAPNGVQMLVDGGRSSRVLSELGKVMPFGDDSIDVVIGTHPDADHIGGLVNVIERYSVGKIIESGGKSSSKIYNSLESKIVEKKIPHILGRAGMRIILDAKSGVYFDILYPDIPDVSTMETNTGSIVGKLVYGATSVMLTADSPIEKELHLVSKDPQILDVDILKLGHHGSRTSSSIEYLRATSPTLAIISAGKNNSYGHPHKEVLDKLSFLHIPYLATYTKGTIKCLSDALIIHCE
jgi:competence protein ComEC